MKCLITILLLILPVIAQSGVYRWVDEKGQVHFGSVPPKLLPIYKPGDEPKASTAEPESKSESIQIHDTEEMNRIEVKKRKDQDVVVEKIKLNNKTRESTINTEDNSNTTSDKDSRERKISGTKAQEIDLDSLKKRIKEDIKASEIIIKDQAPIKDEPMKEEKIITQELVERNIIDKNIMTPESDAVDTQRTASEHPPAVDSVSKNKNQERAENGGNKNNDKQENYGEINKNITLPPETNNPAIKDPAKCGFFTGYVDTYQYRIKFECPAPHCEMLAEKLKKYQKKMELYCEGDEHK